MEESCSVGMQNKMLLDKWTEDDVSSWLRRVGIKECYINKLKDEEVTGPVLRSLRDDFLRKKIGMKSGQIELLLSNREQLLKTQKEERNVTEEDVHEEPTAEEVLVCDSQAKNVINQQQIIPEKSSEDPTPTETLSWSVYRKFDQEGLDFRYIKHSLLEPETGIENMLMPCHEYKSLEIAQNLDSKRLQIKVASEVLRFACACMNMRANGTIHFGVMDKVKGPYKHGEIIGITLQNREDFVDALDYIEKCFNGSDEQCDARKCIRNPRFIEVIEKSTTKKTYVVEYDVVPKASIVKEKYYSVGLPKFFEKGNKIKFEAKTPYCRVGANTPQIDHDKMFSFIKSLIERDQQREEAESTKHHTTGEHREDQKRKLSILLTSGKKHMDNSLFYIIVTNKFHPQHLEDITFLVNMNTLCVFDFDPDSLETGLCAAFRKQKAVTPHFLNDYLNEEQSNLFDFYNKLGLFEKPSWIFCNGRNDFHDKEKPCDDKTWIKTRKKKLKKAVSFICNELLPRKSFTVLFMLMSDVEQPLVETFSEFYEEMNGHESIVILSESKEIYKKWSSLAQVFCHLSTLNEITVTGMPLSHMDATVQSIQLSKNQTTRRLPASSGGVCSLKSADEAMLHSLEMISVDQCENTNLEIMDEDEINKREKHFYHGGKIDWINFWLSDKHKCGDIIKRDAFHETNNILETITSSSPKSSRPIESVTISHHPGSGGSTVARQLLWSWKNKVRCAVVKQCKEIATVSEHAVKLRQHEERDQNNCLPVLLLLEDQKTDDIDHLRRELRNSITIKNITSSALCFILLICNRSNDPERACRISPSRTVAITHELSEDEKPMFHKKRKELERQLELPHPDYLLTFVLLSKGFDKGYIVDFVRNTLAKIDNSSTVTHLIRFVALLNSYVENSHLSVSHCEAFIGLAPYIKLQYHAFVEALSEEAKLLFVDLRDNTTQLSSIRIIHKRVAEELLEQLSNEKPQSAIAKDLITNNLLINHRFGRDEFLKFIKALVIRRNKKSRGDPDDTAFSPLIEHITQTEGLPKAIELMTDAYNSLGKDGIVAQQLARLLYTNHYFKEALEWAEKAKSSLPYDTFVLDTLGQVYKRWFYHLFDNLEEEPSPEGGVESISTALKAISAFRDSEKTPKKENVSLNSSYYGEVEVGCRLLKFLSKVDVFANKTGKVQLMDYLLTDHVPQMVEKPWQKFHSMLKGLQKSLLSALELISEDLCYFQTDISAEDEELDASDPEQLYRPREWLTRKSKVYADFFCNQLDDNNIQIESVIAAASPPQISQFHRQMMTYKLGGGNVTSIMSLIYNKDTKASGDKLERIFDMYNPLLLKDLDPEELEHFIFCQIALNCIKPGSTKLVSLKQLKDHFKFCSKKVKFCLSVTGLYLASLLFWPETDTELNPADSKILLTAIDDLHKISERKMERKRRTVDHFYFGKAKGLNKIVHKSVIEKQTGGPERKEKWLGGEVWKTPQVTQLLKRVDGWTENGRLFVKCGDKNIKVSPRYFASMPLGNENVTFYLGFSFGGVVASDIQIKE